MSFAPLAFLTSDGTRADATVGLTWFTLIISILVCLIVGAILWRAVRKAGRAIMPVERGGSGLRWINVGLLLTAVPLLITLVWTMAALAKVSGPPAHPALTIDVQAHQWWWGATYQGATPAERFETANELHIPVGVPVLVRLIGSDVIHSFWVPRLGGKTDAIPGQRNETWLQADRPGRYFGQCTEFCGWQHAKMAFEVVADSPADFAAWRANQLRSAPTPATPAAAHGLTLVVSQCGSCHNVRGTAATSRVGPDLTHLMSRRLIASGALPNSAAGLSGWILDPQHSKPGAKMPPQHLGADELSDVRAYLATLT